MIDDKDKEWQNTWIGSSIVQTLAGLLVSGGFFYGIARQKRVVHQEKLLGPKKTATSQEIALNIRNTTFLERRLGLDRPLEPSAAAWKSLLGGTIISVTGCTILVLGVAAFLGVKSPKEFREQMEVALPRIRKNILQTLNIQDKTQSYDPAQDQADMQELEQIFTEEKD